MAMRRESSFTVDGYGECLLESEFFKIGIGFEEN